MNDKYMINNYSWLSTALSNYSNITDIIKQGLVNKYTSLKDSLGIGTGIYPYTGIGLYDHLLKGLSSDIFELYKSNSSFNALGCGAEYPQFIENNNGIVTLPCTDSNNAEALLFPFEGIREHLSALLKEKICSTKISTLQDISDALIEKPIYVPVAQANKYNYDIFGIFPEKRHWTYVEIKIAADRLIVQHNDSKSTLIGMWYSLNSINNQIRGAFAQYLPYGQDIKIDFRAVYSGNQPIFDNTSCGKHVLYDIVSKLGGDTNSIPTNSVPTNNNNVLEYDIDIENGSQENLYFCILGSDTEDINKYSFEVSDNNNISKQNIHLTNSGNTDKTIQSPLEYIYNITTQDDTNNVNAELSGDGYNDECEWTMIG